MWYLSSLAFELLEFYFKVAFIEWFEVFVVELVIVVKLAVVIEMVIKVTVVGFIMVLLFE